MARIWWLGGMAKEGCGRRVSGLGKGEDVDAD